MCGNINSVTLATCRSNLPLIIMRLGEGSPVQGLSSHPNVIGYDRATDGSEEKVLSLRECGSMQSGMWHSADGYPGIRSMP